MHIEKLTLKNVRMFADATFEFRPGFNLLVGENGAGKSTILRSLLAVFGDRRQTGGQSGLSHTDISTYAKDLKITARVVECQDQEVIEFFYKQSIFRRSSRGRSDENPFVLFYSATEAVCSSFTPRRNISMGPGKSDVRTNERFLYDSYSQRASEVSSAGVRWRSFGRYNDVEEFTRRVLTEFFEDDFTFSWHFEPYSCVIKTVQPDIKEMKQSAFEKFKKMFIPLFLREIQKAYRLELFAWPDQERIVVNSEGNVILPGSRLRRWRLFEEFEHFLFDIFKKVRDDLEEQQFLGVDSFLAACEFEIRLAPRIQVKKEGRAFQIDQLSDGEQRSFSLFVDIARQLSLQNSDDSREMVYAEALVLIDEIDVHLHPKWQRRIVPALENLFPHCQFIATTHSPFIIQAVQESQIQCLGRPIIGDFTDHGIEEIAFKVMGIEDHEVSTRYLAMLDAAKEYFRLLEKAKEDVSGQSIIKAKEKLDSLSGKYAENPAYQAFLETSWKLRQKD